MTPYQIRLALDLKTGEAGMYILGIKDWKDAYNTWYRIEKTGRFTSGQQQAFKLIEFLLSSHHGKVLLNQFIRKAERREL